MDIPLRRLLCNAMIQPFFDYVCNTWYPNLSKNLKNRLQAAQNKCVRFYLKLEDKTSININEFEKINWLPIHDRVNQCILSSIYKFHANSAPDYMNEVFTHAESNGIPTYCSYQKLQLPHRKTNQALRALSYICPSLWNKLDKYLKTSVSLNSFKHNLTLKRLAGSQFDPLCCFSKNVSSKEKVKPWFFVTFNIILRHIFPENFIEFS